MVGSVSPVSHFETACRDTPRLSALGHKFLGHFAAGAVVFEGLGQGLADGGGLLFHLLGAGVGLDVEPQGPDAQDHQDHRYHKDSGQDEEG